MCGEGGRVAVGMRVPGADLGGRTNGAANERDPCGRHYHQFGTVHGRPEAPHTSSLQGG